MYIDLKKETQIAWTVLGAIVVIGGIVLLLLSGNGELSDEVEKAKAEYAKNFGSVLMSEKIRQQTEANNELQLTIMDLKKSEAFVQGADYVIPPNDPSMQAQHGIWLVKHAHDVASVLEFKAEKLGIGDYDRWLGFGEGSKNQFPDKVGEGPRGNEIADFRLIMFELSEKIAWLAMSTETPLQKLKITHKDAFVETGAEDRPPLLREYPLKLEVCGTHKDVLWILHELTVKIDDPNLKYARPYPLIIRGLLITSLDGKTEEQLPPHDDIVPVNATFEVAAMKFLSEEERGEATPVRASTRSRPSSTSSGTESSGTSSSSPGPSGHNGRPAARE
jgi:hypothetical protein